MPSVISAGRGDDGGGERNDDRVEVREEKDDDDDERLVEVKVLSSRPIALAALWSCPCREMRNSMAA